jgi:hypothetical protein
MLISMDDAWVLGEMKQRPLPLLKVIAEEKPSAIFDFDWSQFRAPFINGRSNYGVCFARLVPRADHD